MAEENKQDITEPTDELTEELENGLDEENEDAEEPVEEKSMDHIKGVFNYTKDNGREYRVVFYEDRKNLIFRELGNEKVEFVGRFSEREYDETNEDEMRALGEKELNAALAARYS